MPSPLFSPDLIFFNGAIATQNSGQPFAQAVAVGNGRILAVGEDNDILKLAGAGTEKIDLDGRLVVPGFIDTHIHFYEWALNRQGLRLDDLTCIEDLASRLQQAAANQPTGRWIMGQGWNETDWTAPRMPTRDVLDKAAPDHPVLLWRCDLHLAAANSPALKLAGIDADTPDPPEGRIERDAAGNPTGILRELAINLARDAVAPPDSDQIMRAFADATGALHRRGVTGIVDVRLMNDKDGVSALQTFQKMDATGDLALRSWVSLPGEQLDAIIGLGLRTGFGGDRLRIGHVKYFSDGGMGARTAWMIDPFLDAECGMPLMDMDCLANDVDRADAAGLSVMIHAVGDRANRELIDLFENLESRRNRSGRPRPAISHRIEHVQMIRPEDADRLGRLHLALCVTPSNMVLDMNLIDAAVGEKGRWCYAFRRLLDTGAPVMFSSDCPVCDPAPLPAIHAAATRQRSDGTPQSGWHPEERITVAEALAAYTATPAKVHQANDLGVIAPGKKSDLVVLSENILEIEPSRISETRVDMTVFGGRIVHREI
ncbi:amidohydrolase [Desulfosarcina widdelii]|uniref:Amidohydrolase n=1 Tax=Desulfosarcina widdelii TaxID=947919 RepID=A0A5K7YY18_9BACT|nr:amidohydrolase [Desulfosarcina widdelii]BBO74662.1 amidohydrolase [Desulfosarcina widdelii]